MKISVKINGELRTADIEPNEILLDVLREKFGIKSPKIGCERGDCGVCTVFLNGRTVRSCLVLAAEADGAEVVTVEALSRNGPTPLQQAFVKHNSFQCGFCAPAMVLTATELLEKNPQPTRREIQEAIAGNLCRCTGYEPILRAIEDVVSSKASGAPSKRSRRIGQRR